MMVSTDHGWKAFDMMNVLSNMSKGQKELFAEIIRSAITGKELSPAVKDITAWACYHSTVPITDEEIQSWDIPKVNEVGELVVK